MLNVMWIGGLIVLRLCEKSLMLLYEYDEGFLYYMLFMVQSQILVIKLGLNHAHKICALF